MAETARPQLVNPREAGAPSEPALPAAIAPVEGGLPALPEFEAMPRGLRIFFDPKWREACQAAATSLSKAVGFAPPHLIGKTESCLAVVNLALTWNLSPYMVASSTYQTPGGSVGYEGKLVHAILEASRRLVGPIRYTHYGDWSQVQRKFEIKERPRQNRDGRGDDERGPIKWAAPTYTAQDEIGLGVTVTCRLRGEDEDRRLDFDMVQAFPRNSTLWATDPKTQLQYAAVRRLASTVVPSLLMGVPFDGEPDGGGDWASNLVDVTPLAEPREPAAQPPGAAREPGSRRRATTAAPAESASGAAPEAPTNLGPGHEQGETAKGDAPAATDQSQPVREAAPPGGPPAQQTAQPAQQPAPGPNRGRRVHFEA
jgi:hypothetical protein